MQAWADGLNYYLATHPDVRPRVINRFEPWMALSFSEGSIGGDIESVPLSQLEAFYSKREVPTPDDETGLTFQEPTGSNGIAIAPSHTRDGHALLLINPHTSFFFRAEQHVTSEQGLDAYGAATWGQFFIYQGFNAAHRLDAHLQPASTTSTSSPRRSSDRAGRAYLYRYGDELRPVTTETVTLPCRTDGRWPGGARASPTFATHHGPIVREEDGKWIACALMNKPVDALEQSFLRTKTSDYEEFIRGRRTQGEQLEQHPLRRLQGRDRLPDAAVHAEARRPLRLPQARRRQRPGHRLEGLHSLESMPKAVNPQNGWAFNTNNWPWTAAGDDSPDAADFPRYFDKAGENPRGPQAIRVLTARRDFTPRTLIEAAFDPYLTAFARLLPGLVAAWDGLPAAAGSGSGSPARSLCCATGTAAGRRGRRRRRWPCSGVRTCGR